MWTHQVALNVLTCFYFFYLGWWLEHEEDLGYGPDHAHAGAPYYHLGAAVFGSVWVLSNTLLYTRRVLASLPLVASVVVLCFTRLPYNETGIPYRRSLAIAAALVPVAVALCFVPFDVHRFRPSPLWVVVVNATFAFYTAWWLAHEDGVHADHDLHRQNRTVWREHMTHIHPEARYFHNGAVPFSLVWLFAFLYVQAPMYLRERPIVLTLLVANVLLLCFISLPFNPDGVNRFFVLAFTLFTFLGVCFTLPATLLRIRLGRLLISRPRTLAEIQEHAYRSMRPVANGWSFWLKYERADDTCFLVSSNWSGVVIEEDVAVVRAGTTFRTLHHALRRAGKTLEDRPQFDDLTVGGAVMTRSTGLNATTSFMDCVLSVDAIKHGTRTLKTLRSPPLQSGWVLVNVTLQLTDDRYVRVSRTSIPSCKIPDSWNTAPYRTIWVDGSVCVMTLASTSVSGTEAFRSTRYDNLLFLIGCPYDRTRNLKVSTLHSMISSLSPIEMAFMRVLRYKNFSIRTHQHVNVTTIVKALKEVHSRVGGRSYLRKCGTETVVDVAVQTKRGADAVMSKMFQIGFRDMSFHSGKWVSSRTHTGVESSA